MVNASKVIFIIATIIVLIVVLIQYIVFVNKFTNVIIEREKEKTQVNDKQIPIVNSDVPIITTRFPTQDTGIPLLPPPTRPFAPEMVPTPPMYPITDPVKIYDYQKMNDPLEEPTKRVDRYLLGPVQLRRMFNYPVRGDPDNPRWLGLLIGEGDNDPNKIIKLFGRQKYPGSDHYEYYTMINMGFDQIKVHIHQRKELYDGDEVMVHELNKKYRVKLNKNDDMAYNPYF